MRIWRSTSILLIPPLLAAIPVFAGIRVLSDTPSALELTVEPRAWSVYETPDGSVPVPDDAALDGRPGGEATPYYYARIGLPDSRRPRVRLLEQRWGPGEAYRPVRGEDDLQRLRVAHLEPGAGVVLGEPYVWRGRWVADLFVVPVRRAGGGIAPLRRLRLRIEYPTARGSQRPRGDRLLRKALLNPRAAAAWGIPTPVSAGKGTASAWPQGTMIRLEIEDEGIYEITPEDLAERGIDPSGIDPRSFHLYNNGGQPLDEDPTESRDATLRENAILVTGEEDGSFDAGDRILFFGRSVNTWKPNVPPGEYRHTMNVFTRANVYWLLIPDDGSPGRRMTSLETDLPTTFTTDRARSRLFVERDAIIYDRSSTPGSGKRWYAAELFAGSSYNVSFDAELPVAGESPTLWVRSRKLDGFPEAVVSLNGVPVDTFSLTNSLISIDVQPGLLRNGSNDFSFRLLSGHGFFDWFEINYLRTLETSKGRMDFDGLPGDGVAEVTLRGLENPWIFDVEAFDDVRYTRQVPFRIESQVTHPRRIIAVEDGNFLHPTAWRVEGIGGPEYPEGLRAEGLRADYIYITHEDFYDAAEELAAYVRQRDGVDVLVVKTDDIYQEFAWGLFDPTAIRDFLMYATQTWDPPPTVCLLVGDGDYDYRNIISSADRNWVPPYEHLGECRDDWFAEFGEDPELIMGRLPVQSSRELGIYTDKLIEYEMNPDYSPWRSRVVLVADDEWIDTGPTLIDKQHMRDAETISRFLPRYLNQKKIYLGPYPTSFDPVTGERRKPEANRDLIESINRGALLINYQGHGNAHVWAHESVFLDSRDKSLVDSGRRLPIYVAATCSWGYFDRPANEAFPEQLLVASGGAIGVIAATRNTSGAGNFNFVLGLYENLFNREERYTLGETLFFSKQTHGQGLNQFYHCLAEPMMSPALPPLDASLTVVEPDSLTALAEATVAGRVLEPNGESVPDFDGEALLTVYDSNDSLQYTFTRPDGSPGNIFNYEMPGGTLFRGLVTTTAGACTTRFIVPRDVQYGSSGGWMQLYVFNEETDGIGATRNVPISLSPATLQDDTPPEIEVYFDQRTWRDGDFTTNQPLLIVDLFDSSGINLTGEIGHSIRATIDGEHEVILTDDFIYERDSMNRGSAEKRIYDLAPGRHRLEVWAWDNVNNFARKEVSFSVAESESEVVLKDILNWPNPFTDRTRFTFVGLGIREVVVKIFTPSGRLVRELGPVAIPSDGFAYDIPGLEWDGRDRFGADVANGVYLYKLIAYGASGRSHETLGKLMRIR